MGQSSQREAGDKTKGFYLQKLRALNLALTRIISRSDVVLYFAVECLGDVFLGHSSESEAGELLEEDKDHSPDSSFTLNSREVRNTLVIFLEVLRKRDFAPGLLFSFYTTAPIGREKRAGLLKNATIPPGGLLGLIAHNRIVDSQHFGTVKEVLLAEYGQQHPPSDCRWIEQLDPDQWRRFFSQICWQFSQKDEVALEMEVLEQVKYCPYYTPAVHEGKEQNIVGRLVWELERRQSLKSFYDRALTKLEIEALFAIVGNSSRKLDDPCWEQYTAISAEDQRNLAEKIGSVCAEYPPNEVELLCRKAVESKILLSRNKGDQSLKAFAYRVYSASYDVLVRRRSRGMSRADLDKLVDEMVKVAGDQLTELSKDYHYSASNRVTIRSMVLDQIDSCYLAFEPLEETPTDDEA